MNSRARMIGFPNELTTVDRTPRCLTVAHHGGPLRGGAGARLLTEAATANHKSERQLSEELTLFLIDLIRKQKEREQQ